MKTAGVSLKVYEVGETGATFERSSEVEVGADLKMKLESATLGKALDLTGVVSGETEFKGKPALTVDFTRVNPAHRRVLAAFVAGDKKAA
jgi:hypothetical protein